MGSIRDINCGTDVSMMEKLGRFDKEFIIYGCTYMKQGKRLYYMTSRREKIYEHIQKCLLNDVWPTSVQSLLVSCAVPAGSREEIAQDAKIALAEQMKEDFSDDYFNLLQDIAPKSVTDGALKLLLNEKNNLEGYFDRDYLLRFEGLIEMAYYEKILTTNSFIMLKEWVKKELRQMEDDIVLKNHFKRTFSGFAYLRNGKINYFYDGQKATVCEKEHQMQKEGDITTPIISKTIWFDSKTSVKTIREQFVIYLHAMLDEKYMDLVKKLKGLKSDNIKINNIFDVCQEKQLNTKETEEIKAYAFKWYSLN